MIKHWEASGAKAKIVSDPHHVISETSDESIVTWKTFETPLASIFPELGQITKMVI